MTNSEIASRLTALRKKKKMNKNALANAAGVSPTYVHQLERGEKCPTVEYLGYLCDALGVTLYEFFTPEDENASTGGQTADSVSTLTVKQRQLLNDFLNSLD